MPPPPHPIPAAAAKSTTHAINASQLRRTGTNSSSTHANIMPPAPRHGIRIGRFIAVAAVVFTVNVAVCAVVPETITEAGTLHVGGSFAAAGVIAQLRLTVPVNPYHGVTEIVDVFPVAAPGATLKGAPVSTEK